MVRIKRGDRIKTPHPAGHDLLGVVVNIIDRRPVYDGQPYGKLARYCRVNYDCGPSEWVAIELVTVCRSTNSQIIAAGGIDERVIELGKSKAQSDTISELDTSSLTHVLPPSPGSSIAVSTIFPDAVGWVECKVIKGRNYYYLRSGGSPQRYLGSTWAKAVDRLPGFLGAPLAGLPF